MALRYGEKELTALQFGEPIVEIDSRYDFMEWTLDSRQPSDGITRTKNEIVITKFKPNIPILVSNFTGTGTGNTPTVSEICAESKGLVVKKMSGLSAANAAGIFSGEYSEHSMIGGSGNTYGRWKGLVFLPYDTTPHSTPIDGAWGFYQISAYVWDLCTLDSGTRTLGDIEIPRGDYSSYNTSGWLNDRVDTKILPDWVTYDAANNKNWQLALCIYTSYTGQYYDSMTGVITLTEPIKFRLENLYPVDPTTIEGYKAAIGEDTVYEKTKSFANTLMRHELASEQTGRYQYPLQGSYEAIESSYNNKVYPIGAAFFDSAARFKIKDAGGQYTITANGLYFLESVDWYMGAPQIAVGDTVTILGRIIGIKNDGIAASMVEYSGRVYSLDGTMSIIGNTPTAPGSPGNAGTLATPYTVDNAVLYARTLGEGTYDTNTIYITGKVTEVLSKFTPSYYTKYDRLRLPVPTDLETLIASQYPIKFWITQYDDDDHPGFWAAVADIFSENEITDRLFASHLFSHSGGTDANGDLLDISLTFDIQDGENYIDMMGIFDASSLVGDVTIDVQNGTLVSLVHAFRRTNNLESITFETPVEISDWQGAFESTALTHFPDNVGALNRWHNYTRSGPDCSISDAADGAALTHFGNWKYPDIYWGGKLSAILVPAAAGTSSNVGTVTINKTIPSTLETNIVAYVCPGVNIPSWDSQSSRIIRMRPRADMYETDPNDNIVFLLQGIGYDANNNKIAATPTYISSKCSTLAFFDPTNMFASAGYTPDQLNTSFVGVGAVEHVSSTQGDPYFYREDNTYKQDGSIHGQSFLPGYIEMELTAMGLQRMDIVMRVFNVSDSYTLSPNVYTFGSYSPTAYMYPADSVGRYAVTSWAISGHAYVQTQEYNIIVDPYCKNAFYASSIREIRYLIDMRYVEPLAWNISENGSYTVFGNGLETAYISNLNKGNWSLDGVARNDARNELALGGNLSNFDEDSANYLLENVFDLRRNINEADKLENDYNSFNGWTASDNIVSWKSSVAFNASGTCKLTKQTSSGGKLLLNASMHNCTVTVHRGNNETLVATLVPGQNTVSISTGDLVTIKVVATGEEPLAVIELYEHFLSELTSGLEIAELYLPGSWITSDIVHSSSVKIANERGWTVYFGGQEYIV